MDKHNCEKLMDEMRGCSICSNVWNNTTKKDLAFAAEHSNAVILELQRKLEAAGKVEVELDEEEIKEIILDSSVASLLNLNGNICNNSMHFNNLAKSIINHIRKKVE